MKYRQLLAVGVNGTTVLAAAPRQPLAPILPSPRKPRKAEWQKYRWPNSP